MTAILELAGVAKSFGGVRAVNDVTFSLQQGEIVGLIGPNGAGKTTLVNLITGVHGLSAGSVRFDGQDVTRTKALPGGATRVGADVSNRPAVPGYDGAGKCHRRRLVRRRRRNRGAAIDLAQAELAFVGLEKVADKPAAALTLPDRKRLELAKSLAMGPRVLLLDEVNAGLNPAEIDSALALIKRIAERGVTILIIEHLMKVVLSLSQRILVLHHGELIAAGEPREVIDNPRVVEAYLGAIFGARVGTEAAP